MDSYDFLKGKACFPFSTLDEIEQFRKDMAALHRDFPDLSLSHVRQYLKGEGELPEGIRRRVDAMQENRKEAISYRMGYAEAQAKLDGLTIPEKYLTGEALDVYLTPETYRYYDFAIYYYFSWYEPWEEPALLTGLLFSI